MYRPGHNKKPMWVCGHEPGKCTTDYNRKSGKGVAKNNPEATNQLDRSALTTMLKTASPNLTSTELESKIQALLSVIES